MPLPIEEMGGLTKGAIEARISQSELRYAQMLDSKIDTLKEGIDERLTKQDDKLEAVFSAVQSIRADNADWRCAQEKQGKEWHEGDLDYRATMQQRMGKVEALLSSIKAWVATFRLLSMAKNAVVISVKEGKQFFLAVTALCGVFVAIVQFIHVVWPVYLQPFLHKLLR